MDVTGWVISWFENNTDMKRKELEEGVSQNYFEKGWIDSLSFISFIADIEEHFRIRFSNEEFHDRTFSTIEGITRIIEGKLNE